LLIFLIHLEFSAYLSAQSSIPAIQQGVLDLRGWDFERDGYINLDGAWAFYYEAFYTDADLAAITPKDRNYLKVPAASWDIQPYRSRQITGFGYATYHLRILLPAACPRLALKTIDQSTAYSLYINKKQIAQIGKPGKTAQTHIGSAKVGIFTFDTGGSELSVLIHISNFSHRKGGIWHSFQLGTEAQMYQIREQSLAVVLLLCGSLLIMSVYHLLLYLTHPKDVSIFYFAILCFVVAWRVTNTGEIYLQNLIPDLSFEWKSKLEYFSTFVISPLLASYLRALFPQELSKKVVIGIHSYIWLNVGLTLVFPTAVFTYFIFPYYVFLPVVICIFLTVLVLAIRRGRMGAWLFLAGVLFLAATVVNDILHSAVVINTYYIAPVGFFVFFFSQASLLAMRSSNAFNQVEILGKELKNINQELESRVAHRTQELANVNTDLNLKNEKLAETNAVKDKLFSIIAHDFRTPLSNLKGVLELLRLEAISEAEIKEIMLGLTDNINYTANLLDNLLLWASSQLKGIETNPTQFEITEVVQENIDLLTPIAHQKRIKIVNNTSGISVQADINMTKLILRNLLSNAIKFTFKEGEILISTTVVGDYCHTTVKDEGMGIDPETQKKLFQVAKNKIRQGTAREKGTGLGLLLCKEFIEKNAGAIWVESIENQGAAFTFSLPLAQPEPK
jgi:signal transduction histidine kinase